MFTAWATLTLIKFPALKDQLLLDLGWFNYSLHPLLIVPLGTGDWKVARTGRQECLPYAQPCRAACLLLS